MNRRVKRSTISNHNSHGLYYHASTPKGLFHLIGPSLLIAINLIIKNDPSLPY